MTDAPTGRQLVEKTFVYITTLSRECRKSLTTSFGQTHRGISFEAVEPTLRQEVETWFSNRDRNITVKHEKSDKGRPGEISMTYAGATKDAHFKFHIDAQFTLSGPSEKAASYLKMINVNVDKRDFTK
jgi:hypothetical protein